MESYCRQAIRGTFQSSSSRGPQQAHSSQPSPSRAEQSRGRVQTKRGSEVRLFAPQSLEDTTPCPREPHLTDNRPTERQRWTHRDCFLRGSSKQSMKLGAARPPWQRGLDAGTGRSLGTLRDCRVVTGKKWASSQGTSPAELPRDPKARLTTPGLQKG